MRYLFLDMDGVMNSSNDFVNHAFDPIGADKVPHLQAIVNMFDDLGIVISSTWRKTYGFERIAIMLSDAGLKDANVVGETPDLWTQDVVINGVIRPVGRGTEIKAWLEANAEPDQVYAIVDDDNDMLEHQWSRLVLTSFQEPNGGLTAVHAMRIIEMLRQ